MSVKTIILIALVAFATGFDNFEVRRPPPDTGLNVKQLIEKYGYPFENHTVQTEDGYILEIHRIPRGRSSGGKDTRPAVLVVPGIFCGSADWVNMGPEKSLGFLLADQGYDVWLANYRGTRWSNKHAWLNPDIDRKEYWTFSFQQIGEYDLPAFIDYILGTTNQEKLFYVGHSQGTTSFFALSSEKPEYNKKVRLSVLLSPAAYLGHATSPVIHFFALFRDQIEKFMDKHEYYGILYNPNLALVARIFCQDGAFTQDNCASIFYIAGGYTPDQLNKTMIPVIASNTPAGGSITQGLHYGQLVLSKNFQKYDYGEEKNLKIYGQSTPPKYDLSKVTAPLAMYTGSKDPYCVKKDVDQTASEIANLVVNKRIEGFNHLDVLWGIDAVPLLYNDILERMKQH